MELELGRESLRCWESVCRVTLEQEETAEMIVPDACPDIWQVLDGEGKLLLQRKEPQEGKAELSGLLKTTILYQPEDSTALESMEVTLPFGITPELSGVTRRCMLRVRPRVLSVDIHLLNPRKVLVRVSYQIEVEAFAPQTLSLASGVQEAETYAVRQKTETFRSLVTVGAQEKSFTYNDTLTLPAGRPDVAKLLSVQAVCTCPEARVIGTKLVLKGEAVLKLLCRGQDGSAFTTDFHLPYSQIMDAGEGSEDAICSLELLFTDVKCTLNSEDPRTFQVELALLAQGILRKQAEVPVLTDLYSTAYRLETEESTVQMQSLLARSEDQEAVREILEIGSAPAEILDVQVRLGRASRRQEGRDCILSQETEIMVLWQGEEGPAGIREKVTVTHRLPEQEEKGCTFVSEILRAPTVALTAGGGAEVSFPLVFRWMALESRERALVSKVMLGEKREEEQERPAVILRVVRPGETLWDVAKGCLSTDGEIMEASGLADGQISPGQMLLIPCQSCR